MNSMTDPPTTPVLIICFGVSGSGKTTMAEYLAEQFQFNFVEADDFHPIENKDHMRTGKALTDAMREPWIASLCEHLKQQRARCQSCVMANSGLRRIHRQRFRELGYPTLFLHLCGPKDVIRRRMESRSSHYMPPALLDSQYDAMEPPTDEPDILMVDVSESLPQVATRAQMLVREFLKKTDASLA